jgi:hypothetical protein
VPHSINQDCSGVLTVNGMHYDIFVSPSGSAFSYLKTDPGNVGASIEVKAVRH